MDNSAVDFETLTQGLPTKSEKIRTLGRAGVSTGAIARFLGIRYQFARNVLVDAGLRGGQVEANTPVPGEGFAVSAQPAAPALLPEWLEIAADGSLKLPKAFLAAAGLEAGGSVMVSAGPEGIDLLSRPAALKRARKILRNHVPEGVSLVDELLADRRREAQLENEER